MWEKPNKTSKYIIIAVLLFVISIVKLKNVMFLAMPTISLLIGYHISERLLYSNKKLLPLFTVQLGHILWIVIGFIFLGSLNLNQYISESILVTPYLFTIPLQILLLFLLMNNKHVIKSVVLLVILNGYHLFSTIDFLNTCNNILYIKSLVVHAILRFVSLILIILYYSSYKREDRDNNIGEETIGNSVEIKAVEEMSSLDKNIKKIVIGFICLVISLPIISLIAVHLDSKQSSTPISVDSKQADVPNSVDSKKADNGEVLFTVKLESVDLIQNNSVGNDWTLTASVNNNKIREGETTNVKLNTNSSAKDYIYLTGQAEEDDTEIDKGKQSISVYGDSLNPYKDNKIQVDVIVRENRGRYAGNTAKWRFNFLITKPKG